MVQECVYIKTDGAKCGSPALRGNSHCYYHNPARASARRAARAGFFLELPLLEHPGAVQAAVREIRQVLGENNVFFRPAMRLLYALQFATREEDESGRGATSSRPLSPPSIRIARAPGFARIYSTANVKKACHPERNRDFAPNPNAETQITDPR
jgi:hypothetical protein